MNTKKHFNTITQKLDRAYEIVYELEMIKNSINPDAPLIEKIKSIFETELDVHYDQIRKRDKKEPLIFYRHMFFAMLIEYAKLGYTSAGRILQRDHSTAINAYRQHKNSMQYDPEYKKTYNKLTAIFEANTNKPLKLSTYDTFKSE